MPSSLTPFTLRLDTEAVKKLAALALTHSVSKQNLLNVMIRNFRPEDHLEELERLMYAKYKTSDQKIRADVEARAKEYLDSLNAEQLALLIESKR